MSHVFFPPPIPAFLGPQINTGFFSYLICRVCLGAFAYLRKATISFVMPICLSVRPHGTSGFPLGTEFYEIWYRSVFSILYLTTDLVHQGHERRKKKKSTAQHVRAATRSIKCERQWRHVALTTAGPIPVTNNMAAYQFSVSASYKQCVSDECTYNIQSRQKHNMLSLLHAACLEAAIFFF